MNFADVTTTAPSPRESRMTTSVLERSTRELVSLVDQLVGELLPRIRFEALRPIAVLRAEIECELRPDVEIDRPALAATCLDLALLLASNRFAASGDLWMRTILLATTLAGTA
jgi:hypothetical protein